MNEETISQKLKKIKSKLPLGVKLVAVSKYQSIESIKEAYRAGQRDFAENYVQELVEKQKHLPCDISWHMIGKLQSNKIKSIAPFIDWIHSIESFKQLQILDKEALKYNRKIKCFLQVKLSEDENKSGISPKKAKEILDFLKTNPFSNIQIKGFMMIASMDKNLANQEFEALVSLFEELKKENKDLEILSMGMSLDYKLAIEKGATAAIMIRLGSAIFGERKRPKTQIKS